MFPFPENVSQELHSKACTSAEDKFPYPLKLSAQGRSLSQSWVVTRLSVPGLQFVFLRLQLLSSDITGTSAVARFLGCHGFCESQAAEPAE